ncbi:MAG: exodeoxyribonuclease VII small subunit [Elusimicrobia bacterium]|nr:exodeoxyribonuclease VII small subunit [Elusimicrobiota bacterium]MDE2236681.1 exodeoxyribonuclease VII small subunit [Elusimicrobiota bacterium]MDE2425067.1 exodeoxyribonuclease VII small subunit [Elusimicrobiota bacterium]
MNKSGAAKKDSFEASLQKLEELVRELEGGEKGLEESLEIFEQGITLAKTLAQQLQEAKQKVEVLTQQNGKSAKTPFTERR